MDFYAFWNNYPKRMGFKATKILWAKLSEEQQKKAIDSLPMHKKMWETWESNYIPFPYNWISGERFEDEVIAPEAPKVAWWTSDASTMDYGRKVGVVARPGEDMNGYRARLRMAA